MKHNGVDQQGPQGMSGTERRRSRVGRTLAVSAGMTLVAALFAAPAQPNTTDSAFLSALDDASFHVDDPEGTANLGQSICPMLEQPGATLASAANTVARERVPPEMAELFARIAVSMYCPSMVDSLAAGEMPKLPPVPGLPTGA